MRKILPAIALLSMAAILAAPAVSLAFNANIPPDCCKLRANIDLGETGDVASCTKDHYVAETNNPSNCKGTTSEITCVRGNWGMYCLMNTLVNIVNWIFIILVALAAILVIIGAFQILTSAGSPDKVSSGRNMILYAAIGLLVAFLAKAVPGIVKMVSGF